MTCEECTYDGPHDHFHMRTVEPKSTLADAVATLALDVHAARCESEAHRKDTCGYVGGLFTDAVIEQALPHLRAHLRFADGDGEALRDALGLSLAYRNGEYRLVSNPFPAGSDEALDAFLGTLEGTVEIPPPARLPERPVTEVRILRPDGEV